MSESPLELLKEEMESDEISLRVNAIHRAKVIASLIGFDGIKNQLLPYFERNNFFFSSFKNYFFIEIELIKKEDDEVLFAIAEELGNLRLDKNIRKPVFFLKLFPTRINHNSTTLIRAIMWK